MNQLFDFVQSLMESETGILSGCLHRANIGDTTRWRCVFSWRWGRDQARNSIRKGFLLIFNSDFIYKGLKATAKQWNEDLEGKITSFVPPARMASSAITQRFWLSFIFEWLLCQAFRPSPASSPLSVHQHRLSPSSWNFSLLDCGPRTDTSYSTMSKLWAILEWKTDLKIKLNYLNIRGCIFWLTKLQPNNDIDYPNFES